MDPLTLNYLLTAIAGVAVPIILRRLGMPIDGDPKKPALPQLPAIPAPPANPAAPQPDPSAPAQPAQPRPVRDFLLWLLARTAGAKSTAAEEAELGMVRQHLAVSDRDAQQGGQAKP